MDNGNNEKKSNNQIYCCFNNEGDTLAETLKVSFLDYLILKKQEKSLANTHKES